RERGASGRDLHRHPCERGRSRARGPRESRRADAARRRAGGSRARDPVATLGRILLLDRHLHRRVRRTLKRAREMTMDIRVQRDGAILDIAFGRPARRNAISAAMYDALAAAIAEAERERGLRVMVI